jgi:hypothetical protein
MLKRMTLLLAAVSVVSCRGELAIGGADDGGATQDAATPTHPGAGVPSGPDSGWPSLDAGPSFGADAARDDDAGPTPGSITPPGNPTALGSVSSGPGQIAVDGTNVYVASYEIGPVVKVPIDGSGTVTLDQISATTVAINSTSVFTLSPQGGNNVPQGLIVSCAKSGCGGNPTTIASNQTWQWGIAADDGAAYWTSQQGKVMTAPLDGGAAKPLDPNEGGAAIVLAGNEVLFTTGASVLAVPKAGGASRVVLDTFAGPDASSQSFEWLAADSNNVYFTTTSGMVGQAPLDGSGVITALGTVAFASLVAVDEGYVYWAGTSDKDGDLVKTPIGGGAVTILATGQGQISGIATNAKGVFWLANGNTVMGMAK